jgi:hypothetical protein
METKRVKELTKLMSPLVAAGGMSPEYSCFIQTDRLFYNYNGKMLCVVPNPSDTEFTVNAPNFSKFVTPKSVSDLEILQTGEDDVLEFVSGAKKMTLKNEVRRTQSLVDAIFDEIQETTFVDVAEVMQKSFVKLLKQTYLSMNTDYSLAGLYLCKDGLYSCNLQTISFYEMSLPIDNIIHIPSEIMDCVIKIKEPIVKIGFYPVSNCVYFVGESGIYYVCNTTQLRQEIKDSLLSNIETARGTYSQPHFRITDEFYEALEQDAVAGSAGLNLQLCDNCGKLSSQSYDSAFEAEFGWDENVAFDFTIKLDYALFMKYASIGTIIRPIDGETKAISLNNEKHTIFMVGY